jgi:hypothetical protein
VFFHIFAVFARKVVEFAKINGEIAGLGFILLK